MGKQGFWRVAKEGAGWGGTLEAPLVAPGRRPEERVEDAGISEAQGGPEPVNILP